VMIVGIVWIRFFVLRSGVCSGLIGFSREMVRLTITATIHQ